ncbi:MAG: cytochrome c biogenesis protein [Verrucomicrobiales bacterium]
MSQPASKPHSKKGLRWALVIFVLLVQFGGIAYSIKSAIPPKHVPEVSGYSKWSEDIIATASAIPVQDGGRVKPLSTYAGFFMLNIHGSRSMKIESAGETKKIGPTELLLDFLFRPELAKDLPVFRVEDSDVVEALGIEVGKKRARYSFNEIETGYDKLLARGREIQDKIGQQGSDSLTRLETQTKDLADKVLRTQGLMVYFDFAREMMIPEGSAPFTSPSGERLDLSKFSSWVRTYPNLGVILREMGVSADSEIPEGLRSVFSKLELNMNKAQFGVPLVPPYATEDETWKPLGTTMREMTEQLGRGENAPWAELADDLATIEKLAALSGDPKSADFAQALAAWRDDLSERSAARGLGGKIDSEVSYYERKYFTKGIVYFLLAFLLTAFGWFAPANLFGKILNGLSWTSLVAALVIVSIGIYHRCYLMSRPPVGNLYDTIPFITVIGAAVFALAELMTRRRIMLTLAALMGLVGLFLASRFEVADGKDHMDPLVAVLRSNFWLATHVVMITIGYSGGLMACVLSHVYVHLRLAGLYDGDQRSQRFYNRSVYGLICFTLFFSLVGTVLGGIWANDSWGRFWGWDPKENGALLIVLWCLIILHARLAGHFKEWGLHIASIFGGIIVGFSWWGVNLLGVGLHNYGFIDGIGKINIFYGIELVAMIVGVLAMYFTKRKSPSPA